MDASIGSVYNWSSSRIVLLKQELKEIINGIIEVKSADLIKEIIVNTVVWNIILDIQGGKLENKYIIKLRLPEDYPNSLPVCFEMSRNFPKTGSKAMKRHIVQNANYTNLPIEGSFCMISSFRIRSVFGNNVMDAYNTINLLLIKHLLNQEFFTRTGTFMGNNGFYKHGPEGLIQSFKELVDVENESLILNILLLNKKNALRPNDKCYCGSNKAIRCCHSDILNKKEHFNVNDEHIENLIKYLIAKYIIDWTKIHKIRYVEWSNDYRTRQEYFIMFFNSSEIKTVWLINTHSWRMI